MPPPAKNDVPVVVPLLQEGSSVPSQDPGDVPVVARLLQGGSSVPPPANGDRPVVIPLLQMGSNVPPPAYEEANDPKVSPPTYESALGRLRKSRRSSSGNLDFLKKGAMTIIGTVGCTIILALVMVIPISMIVLGTIYLHECPAEPNIPIYLIVGGVFGVLRELFEFCARCGRSEQSSEHLQMSICDNMVNCFLLAWFIAGNVWVYKIYEPEYEDKQSENYCNKIMYLFAFWQISSAYIIIGIAFVCLCCIGIASTAT